jgi:DNA-binding CsgD family transcriptional regulator
LATISQICGNYCPHSFHIKKHTHGISSQLGTAMKTQQPTLAHHQQGFVGIKPVRALQDSDLLAHALDELACGVIITDGHSQLLHSNLAGQLVLSRAQCLQLQRGQVQTLLPQDAEALTQAQVKALQGKRSMLTIGPSGQQQTVAVVPLDRQHSQDSQPTPRIALIFSRSGMCEQLMLSFFSRAHQLTPSEEQILGLLCTGLTAPEMSQQLRVGEATVRTHIRSICSKTSSHGIREVVKRLALLPPLMAAVMPTAFA